MEQRDASVCSCLKIFDDYSRKLQRYCFGNLKIIYFFFTYLKKNIQFSFFILFMGKALDAASFIKEWRIIEV